MGLICSKITSCRHVVGAKRAQMGTKPAYRPPGPSFATIYTATKVMAVAVAVVAIWQHGSKSGMRCAWTYRGGVCVCVCVGMEREEESSKEFTLTIQSTKPL